MVAVERNSTERTAFANTPADRSGEKMPRTNSTKRSAVQSVEPLNVDADGVSEPDEFVKKEIQESDVVLDDAETEKLANETDKMLIQDLCIEDQDIVGQYLQQAGDHTILTREEETKSFIAIELGREKRVELFDFAGSDSEKQELFFLIDEGLKAEQHIARHNLRLVISIAKKYVDHGLAIGDLIQEGNLGLLRAMKKFDFRKGNKFSTYATFWIRRDILEACAEKANTIRYPQDLIEEVARMVKVKYLYGVETEALAKKLNISVERVAMLEGIREQRRIANLGEPSKQLLSNSSRGGEVSSLEDAIPSTVDTEDQSDRHVIGTLLRTMLVDVLTPEEYQFMTLKYPLTLENAVDEFIVGKGLKEQEIAELMDISFNRVQTLKHASFLKIRRYFQINRSMEEQFRSFIGSAGTAGEDETI